MNDGEILRAFIDNQHKSKVSIAADLGMSKQNLFGLFKSRELSAETKAKFEGYFKQSIFTEAPRETLPRSISMPALNNSDTALVQSLREQIKTLQSHCEFVQKTYEEKLKTIEVSLNECLSNQAVMMRQIAVATHLSAARYAGADKKKLQDEMQKINTMIASVKD